MLCCSNSFKLALLGLVASALLGQYHPLAHGGPQPPTKITLETGWDSLGKRFSDTSRLEYDTDGRLIAAETSASGRKLRCGYYASPQVPAVAFMLSSTDSAYFTWERSTLVAFADRHETLRKREYVFDAEGRLTRVNHYPYTASTASARKKADAYEVYHWEGKVLKRVEKHIAAHSGGPFHLAETTEYADYDNNPNYLRALYNGTPEGCQQPLHNPRIVRQVFHAPHHHARRLITFYGYKYDPQGRVLTVSAQQAENEGTQAANLRDVTADVPVGRVWYE